MCIHLYYSSFFKSKFTWMYLYVVSTLLATCIQPLIYVFHLHQKKKCFYLKKSIKIKIEWFKNGYYHLFYHTYSWYMCIVQFIQFCWKLVTLWSLCTFLKRFFNFCISTWISSSSNKGVKLWILNKSRDYEGMYKKLNYYL